MQPVQRWWGPLHLENGDAVRFRVGALEMWIENRPHEWRISSMYGPDLLEPRALREGPLAPAHPEGATLQRFAAATDAQELDVRLALADRDVVFRPETAFHVMGDDAATIFVSSPLWLRLVDPAERVLTEIPTWRPTDTWFGPSPREGELCYASRTSAKLDDEELVVRTHRALTRITLENEGDEPLRVERIRVPLPHLELAVEPDGDLWTSPVTVVRDREGHSRVRIGESDRGETLAAPRRPRDNRLERALSFFLG